MSSEYQVVGLLVRIKAEISKRYPCPPNDPLTCPNRAVAIAPIMNVITACQSTGLRMFIPSAYYCLAAKPLKDIIFFLRYPLNCIKGREALLFLQRDALWKVNFPDMVVGCCKFSGRCRLNWVKFITKTPIRNRTDVFSFNITHCTAKVCQMFKLCFGSHLKSVQKNIWENILPTLFDLDPSTSDCD